MRKHIAVITSVILFVAIMLIVRSNRAAAQPPPTASYLCEGASVRGSSLDGKDVSTMSFSALPTFSSQWIRTYSGYPGQASFTGGFVQQTSDSGYVVGGATESFGAGKQDFLILKLNADGSIAWQHTYGGSGNDSPGAITTTKDDGYVVVGHADSFNGPPDQGDSWALKLNSGGTIAWQKSYGDGGNNVDVGTDIRQTKDGGYLLGGWTVSFSAVWPDFWLLKLNSDGTVAWENTYGGSGWDYLSAINQTSDGGFIVTGRTDSFGAAYFDAWVLKLNANGSVTWGRTYGEDSWDSFSAIRQTTDGGFIAAGYTGSFGAGEIDGWVVKLNSDGIVDWQKSYGGPSTEFIWDVQETTDNGFILLGSTDSFGAGDSDLWLIKLNPNGTIEWERTYGGVAYDSGSHIERTADGGFIIGGLTESFGNPSLWVLKLDSSGKVTSCGVMGSSNAIVSNTTAVIRNAKGNVRSSAAIVTNTNVSPETASSQTSVICQFTPPSLGINYSSGSPGSFFTLVGSDFPPNSLATVVINGRTVTDTLAVDSSGGFEFLLESSQADPGRYFVTALVNPSATIGFNIDQSAPLRPKDGTGPILTVPGGIAFTRSIYLPNVQK